MQNNKKVSKFVLKNGMTLLVVPVKNASRVAAQIWYNVGSKHETFGERGMAHFIEHMVFKGTHEMLSESDVNLLGSKLSASMNAGTWYDFTYYYFTLPLANWENVLPIFAEWMQHCRFRQDHMDSEVKAVIQELKMINDNYTRFLLLNMISTIFDSHPYHYTTIGFKQDLWNLKRDTLVSFYKKYYIPQNATLVVVGDVEPAATLEKIKKYFDAIPCGQKVADLPTFFNADVGAKSVQFYRDIEQSIGALAFVVPGMNKKMTALYEILEILLANGKSSRLYKKLVDDLALVSEISASGIGTHEHELFCFIFKPKHEDDFFKIKQIILEEIQNVIVNGFSETELQKAIKTSQMEKQLQLENVELLAQKLGWNYVATGDEFFIFESIDGKEAAIQEQLKNLLITHFRPSLCHEGRICKISDSDKKYLEKLQQETAEFDGEALAQKERESLVESSKYADSVSAKKAQKKSFFKPSLFSLDNGLEILFCKTDAVDTISCLLQMKADNSYTPDGLDGALDIVYKMMLEGTTSYPGVKLAEQIESYGMNVAMSPGSIAFEMLASDSQKGFDFIRSMVQEAVFDSANFAKVKDKQKRLIAAFFDDPKNIRMQEAKELIYKKHPYGKTLMGTEQSIQNLDRDLCYHLYKKYVSPQDARLIVVGNFDEKNLKEMITKTFGKWTGEKIDDITYPVLTFPKAEQKFIEKNRDQVFMAFVGLSVRRLDPDYDALLIYDQILSGSSLFSMDTLLFRLREQAGLFYTAGGSILTGSDKEPGMVYIATMVAPDRTQEAYDLFIKLLIDSVDNITDEEFELAKENIISSYCNKYDTNAGRVTLFNFMRKFHLPFDYFENRFDSLRAISKEKMIHAVKKIVHKDVISCIKIGKIIHKK
ncbi:insulinase family protein [Candidatus Dependentiae bacterium]|nr:insulinase family protein [Candidatus Dependentiae bacterium]